MSPKLEDQSRRATKEELEEGADQILEAHLRMESQYQKGEELPIEDRRGGSQKEVVETKQSTEVARKKTRSEPRERAPRNPSPTATALVKPDAGSTSTELRTPGQQEKNGRRKEGQKKEDEQSQKLQEEEAEEERGFEGSVVKEETEVESEFLPPRSILFTPEQLSHMNQMYERAPWLYGTSQSAFTPFMAVQRPSFLEQEEGRQKDMEKEAREVQAQREFWKNAAKEQREKDDMRRMMQEAMKENQFLKKKIEDMDAKMSRAGERYLTPESSRRLVVDEKEDWKNEEKEDSEEEEESQEASQEGHQQKRSREDFNKQPMKFMMLMMETMKEFQKSMGSPKDEGMVRGVEVVRSGSPDLPLLASWDAQTGPLQLGDWLLLVEPIVSDLSVTANDWWKLIVEAAEEWYRSHIAMAPLERVKHVPEPPDEVAQQKWQRVERRTSAMLLQAVPSTGRDELEIGSVSDAPAALRRWMRWRHRNQGGRCRCSRSVTSAEGPTEDDKEDLGGEQRVTVQSLFGPLGVGNRHHPNRCQRGAVCYTFTG